MRNILETVFKSVKRSIKKNPQMRKYGLFLHKKIADGYKVPFYNYALSHHTYAEALEQEISVVLNCRNTAELYYYVAETEALIAKYCKRKYAVGVASGTAALTFALRSLGVRPGDEVITTPHTYLATAFAITDIGSVPVFVDADPATWNINSERIKSAISSKTRAIVPVHMHGATAHMDTICSIAKEYGISVVEDTCQAHGATYKGRLAGAWGDAGCFSFHPSKIIGVMGDAGAIVTDSKNVATTIRHYQELDNNLSDKFYSKRTPSRLDPIHAAFLRVYYKNLPYILDQRKKLAILYSNLLNGCKHINIHYRHKDFVNAYRGYALCCAERDSLKVYLAKQGIETKVHYPVPLHCAETFSWLGHKCGDFPIAEKIAREILLLPLNDTMNEQDIIFVADKIKEYETKIRSK